MTRKEETEYEMPSLSWTTPMNFLPARSWGESPAFAPHPESHRIPTEGCILVSIMSQQATGTANIQISVAQSQSVAININGQLAVKLVSPAFPRPPTGGKAQEIDLLKAPLAAIPFAGRTDFLSEFLTWCNCPEPVSFRILTGQGGAGKTRFAYELYGRIRRQTSWGAYFFEFYKEEAKGVNLWNEIPASNSLLIADYASDHAQPLADLLRSLTASTWPADGRRIRILLLARMGDWQRGWLRDLKSGRTGGEVDRLFQPREPIEFPPLSGGERLQIFKSAVEQLVELNAKPMPLIPEASVFEQPDVAARLADPLTLMMAAVTAVHSGSTHALTLNRTELAFEVAETLVAERLKESVRNHQALFLHMAAIATLCGGLTHEEALAALEAEADATKLGRVTDPESFLKKLQAWLPSVAKAEQADWMGSIQPDIVGEAFVIGSKAHANLQAAEATVLRAYRCRGSATVNAVIRAAQDFSLSASSPRTEPVFWMEALFKAAESDQDLARLAELSDAMPLDSVPLRVSALRAAASLVNKLRSITDDASDSTLGSVLANSINTLSVRQSAVGQRAEALETAREAVALYRQQREAHLEAFAGFLAKAFWTMGGTVEQLNQQPEAISTFADALRTILPEVEKYPQAHLGLCLALASDYFSAIKSAQIAPDDELVPELMRIVGPHLPQTDSGEPAT